MAATNDKNGKENETAATRQSQNSGWVAKQSRLGGVGGDQIRTHPVPRYPTKEEYD